MSHRFAIKAAGSLAITGLMAASAVLAQGSYQNGLTAVPTATQPATTTTTTSTTSTTTTNANDNTNSAATSTTTSTTTTTQKTVAISPDQITAAGFTGVTVQAPSGTGYQAPVFYFRADQTLSGQNLSDWGAASNLIAVLVEPKFVPSWSLNNNAPLSTDLNGRTQVQLTDVGYYIVVTGPDQAKVSALVNALALIY